jgi:hypothetical protein
MSTERHYADHRPYAEPPARLGELVGPTSGFVTLPPQIDCGPPRPYDMASDDDRRIVYERVLREASSTADVCRYVKGAALLELWHLLWLPARVREMWQRRLPELDRAA